MSFGIAFVTLALMALKVNVVRILIDTSHHAMLRPLTGKCLIQTAGAAVLNLITR